MTFSVVFMNVDDGTDGYLLHISPFNAIWPAIYVR